MASMQTSLLAVVAVVAAAAASFATASGASYTVGEPGGSWDLRTNYTTWASSITFRRGDQLVFKYLPAAHDVVEVTKDGYLSCSPSSPISALRSGQDTISLNRLGRRYFICGVPEHCTAGMKLQVEVRVVCDSLSPPGANGTPGANAAPGANGVNGGGGGFCVDGDSPTTIITTGSTSYNSAPGSSGSVNSALVVAATTLLYRLMV